MIEYIFLIKNFLIYIILCPLFINFLRINSIVIHLSIFFIILIFNLFYIAHLNLISIWLNFCVFTFLVCIYIFIHGALETSISIKILNELEKKKIISINYITKKNCWEKFIKKNKFLIKKKNDIKKKWKIFINYIRSKNC